MDFSAIGIELGLLALALLFLAMGVLLPKKESRTSLAAISVVALLALFAYGFSFYRGGEAASFYAGLYVVDNYAVFFKQLFLLSAALVVRSSTRSSSSPCSACASWLRRTTSSRSTSGWSL